MKYEQSRNKMAKKQHVDLRVVEEFLRKKIYPKEIAKDKGKKANFKRACRKFSNKDGELFYNESRRLRLFMTFMKEKVKMEGQKPWLVIVSWLYVPKVEWKIFLAWNVHVHVPLTLLWHCFRAVLNSSTSIREIAHNQASQNIAKAQAKQRKYFSNLHKVPEAALQVESKVLLEEQKWKDRKGEKFTYRWMRPYILKSPRRGLCSLVNKKRYNAIASLSIHHLNPTIHLNFSLPASDQDADNQQSSIERNFFDYLMELWIWFY